MSAIGNALRIHLFRAGLLGGLACALLACNSGNHAPSAAAPAPAPTTLGLTVRDAAGLSRVGEVVSNGIPIPRDFDFKDPAALRLVDGSGAEVPAQFEVLSRWAGGRLSNQPIQWLHVAFPASVVAAGSATFSLTTGSPAAVAVNRVQVAESGTEVAIDTGAATFVLPKAATGLFSSIRLPGGTIAGGAGNMTLQVDAQPLMTALPPDEVRIERNGPLLATVRIAGRFDAPPYAGVVWKYVLRASFKAGSPLAVLDLAFIFPGNKDGTGKWSIDYPPAGEAETVVVHDMTVTLPHALAGALEAHVSATATTTLTAPLGAGARLVQQGRANMKAPAAFAATAGTRSASGSYAEQAMLGVGGSNGKIALALERMRHYEPQALEADAASLKIKVVADRAPFGPWMGGFARMAVGAFPAGQSWSDVKQRVLGELEHGLMAWPSARDATRSGAFMELWDGSANADGQAYAAKLDQVNANTLAAYLSYRTHGFMTHGLPVRYWDPSYQEFGDTATWNGYFLGGTFADYHQAMANPVRTFARTGDPELLRGLAYPAARRMLHSMIIQGDPAGPAATHAGWAPAGYGAYRTDGNSSHSYFENLFFYYYLTGDRRVLDVLAPGGDTLRKGYARRADGSLVDSASPPLNDWRGSTDRVASQFAAIYWFLGHASDDASFLDDFRNQMGRAVDRYTGLLTRSGKEYAFISEDDLASAGGNRLITGQAWMTSFYAMENVWRLRLEYGNVPLGQAGVAADRLLAGVARGLWDFNARLYPGTPGFPAGTGEVAGTWATSLAVDWTGARIGGEIASIAANMDSASAPEPALWLTGKAALCATLARAGDVSGDTALKSGAAAMARHVLSNTNTTNMYWGKEAGLSFTRLHPAYARMTGWVD